MRITHTGKGGKTPPKGGRNIQHDAKRGGRNSTKGEEDNTSTRVRCVAKKEEGAKTTSTEQEEGEKQHHPEEDTTTKQHHPKEE